MARPFKREVNFLKPRKIYFTIAVVFVIATAIALPLKGLNFGIEFVGGTSVEFSDTGDISIEQMRSAWNDIISDTPIIQTSTSTTTGESGFIVRISETDAARAYELTDQVLAVLGLPENSGVVTTIGPGWGAEVTRRSVIAFTVAIVLIIAYIGIRFRDFKMGVSAVASLVHDLIIIVGIYAILGREVTPNVIAALLTIMGYSLYDSVVVFHRVNDNMTNTERHSFMTVANHSINQVFMRTINTTIAAIIPVLAMLFFGGETLKDFAFAMTIGLLLGPYSSIAIASPIYALWKQTEPKFKKLAKKYGEGLDVFTVAEQLGD